jgi:hypothetical protein
MDTISERLFLGSSGGADSYWLTTLSSGNTLYFFGSAVDSTGNIFAVGSYVTNFGSDDSFLCKFDSTGSLLWQRVLGGNQSDYTPGITCDSAGNVYVCGSSATPSGGSYYYPLIYKFDTSGSIQWQTVLTNAGYPGYGRAITTDSSNNIYYIGYEYAPSAGSYAVADILKLDSAGSILWKKYFLTNSSGVVPGGVVADKTGNVYVAAYSYYGAVSSYSLQLMKYAASTGALTWQEFYTQNNARSTFPASSGATSVDSTGNVIAAAYSDIAGGGVSSVVLTKTSSSGSSLWVVYTNLPSSDTANPQSCAVDASDNIYVWGYTGTPSIPYSFIIKYDSSGTIIWARKFSHSTYALYGSTKLSIDSKNNIILPFYLNTPTVSSGVLKVPSDGSKTGTYGSFTYASLSVSTPSYSFVLFNSGYTDGNAPYLSPNNAGLSVATTTVPATTITL